MKTPLLAAVLAFLSFAGYAQHAGLNPQQNDSIKVQLDGKLAYYQKVVKADSIPEGLIYIRALQFMASRNFQQNYGNQQEGKLIFTTIQDLNVNLAYVGDENDPVDPYTVTFAITLDLKNGLYRYTIHNVIIYRPDENGNRRQTLYDMYAKATNADSRRISKNAKKLIESFERYLNSLTEELYQGVKQKTAIYSRF